MRMRVIRVDTLIAWSAIAHFVAEEMRFVGILVFTANEPSPFIQHWRCLAFVHLKQEKT